METSHLLAQATGTTNVYDVTSSTTNNVVSTGIPAWLWITILVIILVVFLIWLSSQSKTR